MQEKEKEDQAEGEEMKGKTPRKKTARKIRRQAVMVPTKPVKAKKKRKK